MSVEHEITLTDDECNVLRTILYWCEDGPIDGHLSRPRKVVESIAAKVPWPNKHEVMYYVQPSDTEKLLQEIERLQTTVDGLHPRVLKLLNKNRRFIVIGEHEPYYMQAYALIREQEMKQGTWTENDRVAFAAAQLAVKAGGE